MRDAPRLLWPLTERAQTVARNRGGNPALQGTYTNKPPPGFRGPAFGSTAPDFNGSTQRVQRAADAALSPDPGGDFSVEVWCQNDAATPGTAEMIVTKDAPTNREYWLQYNPARGFAFAIGNTASGIYLEGNEGGTATDARLWHHIVGTYVGATPFATLYVDGLAVGTDNTTSGSREFPSLSPFYVGARGNDTLFWNGRISCAAYYGYALTAERVRAHTRAMQLPELSPPRALLTSR